MELGIVVSLGFRLNTGLTARSSSSLRFLSASLFILMVKAQSYFFGSLSLAKPALPASLGESFSTRNIISYQELPCKS